VHLGRLPPTPTNVLNKLEGWSLSSRKRSIITSTLLAFKVSYATADLGSQQIISSNATEVIDAFPADMDGDGDIDVLAAKPGSPFGGGSVVIYRNNGNGSFTEQVSPSRLGKNFCVSH